MLSISPLVSADIPQISAAFDAIGWRKPPEQYRAYLADCVGGSRLVAVARWDGIFAGYATLNWQSSYPPFGSARIPEIEDLNVLPPFRLRGIASRLLDHVEGEAFERSRIVGIGVGLSADYGPAQRLYARRGYVPDGAGAMSHGKLLIPGESVRVDDDLVLHLTKRPGA